MPQAIKVPLDLCADLSEQIPRIQEAIEDKKRNPKKELHLYGWLNEYSGTAPKISEVDIKTLMLQLSIDEYHEFDEAEDTTYVKYTYESLERNSSDFIARNIRGLIAGLITPPLVAAAGALIAFSIVAPPLGLPVLAAVAIAAGAAFVLSALVAGIVCLVKTVKENRQLAAEKDKIEKNKDAIEKIINAAEAGNSKEKIEEMAVKKQASNEAGAKRQQQDIGKSAKEHHDALLRRLEGESEFGVWEEKPQLSERERAAFNDIMGKKLAEPFISKKDVEARYEELGLFLDILEVIKNSGQQDAGKRIQNLYADFASLNIADLWQRKDQEEGRPSTSSPARFFAASHTPLDSKKDELKTDKNTSKNKPGPHTGKSQ